MSNLIPFLFTAIGVAIFYAGILVGESIRTTPESREPNFLSVASVPKLLDVTDAKTGKVVTVDEAEAKINSFYR